MYWRIEKEVDMMYAVCRMANAVECRMGNAIWKLRMERGVWNMEYRK